MFDITDFSLKEMTQCGADLRQLGDNATTMETVANRIVDYLNLNLVDRMGDQACAMIRFFITVPYGALDEELKNHAHMILGYEPDDDGLKCQTILATVGVEPAWNDRHQSRYYKTLPMTPKVLADNPMYVQFAEIFNVVLDRTILPDPDLVAELEQTTYNVFHVPVTVGSEYIPDQKQFVIPYNIQSVIGFVGMLPSSQIFSVVLFTRVPVPRDVVSYFKTLAFNVKMAILPFDEIAVFADKPLANPPVETSNPIQLRSEVGSLRQLVSTQEQVVVEQSERIEAVLLELRNQTKQLKETNEYLEQQIEENEKLRQQAAEVAIVEERNRLARDLHDSVTQSLYSLTLFAEASQRLASNGDIDRAKDYLKQVGDTAQQALKEMRLLVYELRPLMLEKVGLIGALQQRLDAVEGRTGIETQLQVNDIVELPTHIEEALYRIAQEALNNTLKHANAQSVSVNVILHDNHIRLAIIDDGDGFDTDEPSSGGLGLTSIRERAEKLGATLIITSAPGAGTQIELSLVIDYS